MDFIEIWKIVIIGIVEGITEWLPISSTGHMILTEHFMPLKESPVFVDMFNVVIQLGAIIAVGILYFHKLNPFSSKKNRMEKTKTAALWMKVIVACVPAAVLGLLLDDFLTARLYNFPTVALMLLIYGVLFIILENRNKSRTPIVQDFGQLTYGMALLIGVFQVLALIPGTSRSGATILGAMLLGTSRYIAAEFSFFLAIPVMFGASALKILKFGFRFTGTEIVTLLVGMVVAFFVSILAIKFLMGYIKKNDFKAFGYYRIILGIILLICYFFIL